MKASPVDIDSLRQQLQPLEPLRLYALVDASVNQSALDFLYQQETLNFDTIFPGELEPDVFEMSPFLVDLHNQPDTLDWLLEGWGASWVSFLHSAEPLEALQIHLRQFTEVRTPDNEVVWFRFYDPRVMRSALPLLDGEQSAALFRGIKMFVCEGDSPNSLLRLSFDGSKPLVSTIKLS
jgi:hypothetical protein